MKDEIGETEMVILSEPYLLLSKAEGNVLIFKL